MRTFVLVVVAIIAGLAAGCTTTPQQERPKIHCPACGTELDAIFHKSF